jgi:hypothetical protein
MSLCYLTFSLARWLELHELSALSVTVSPDGLIWLDTHHSSLSNIFVLFTPITPVPQCSGWSIIMSTKPEWEWGADMNKTAALEEMYLIYQAVRNYLADSEPWGEFGMEDLVASYRSFCQREPLGGMFLESVLEELMDRARGCSWRYN